MLDKENEGKRQTMIAERSKELLQKMTAALEKMADRRPVVMGDARGA